MEGNSTSFEKAMRGVHSSKWQEAKEDEMKSINTNDVWDKEKFPMEPKQQAVMGLQDKDDSKGNIERYPKGIWKAIKRHLW